MRPLAETLAKVLQSGDAERRARFLCEGLAKIAALAALAEAKSDFASLYGDTRLTGARFAQFGTADLGSAEQALMDRAAGAAVMLAAVMLRHLPSLEATAAGENEAPPLLIGTVLRDSAPRGRPDVTALRRRHAAPVTSPRDADVAQHGRIGPAPSAGITGAPIASVPTACQLR